jgi:cytochrome c5
MSPAKAALPRLAVSMALLIASQAMAADGKEVYNTSCAFCHNTESPKLGDKAAWELRLEQGADGLVTSVLMGKGAMPAKGGNATLSEADIKAAVDYMVAQVK